MTLKCDGEDHSEPTVQAKKAVRKAFYNSNTRDHLLTVNRTLSL